MSEVRMQLDEQTLQRLLKSGHLCAADFRCLDCESKACVWRLLLQQAARQCEHKAVSELPL
ncbi:hypothetical protein Q4485_04805 [Granulosicoccaceae sp. 1_MG-2023]|nr:hypothetical protein [Granulosicoccaceae sp. 1_MG-2023]